MVTVRLSWPDGMAKVGEVIDGIWRLEATHPEWTEAEGGEEGWEQTVAWWAVRTIAGLVLIDPLVEDWPDLDELVTSRGRCAAVVRTCHWHERSVAEAAARYDAPVIDQTSGEAPAGWRAVDVERNDEIALWLPDQLALLFGDAMLRESGSGRL